MSKKKIDTSTYKSEWDAICNKYLHAFCNKHKYILDTDAWTSDDAGTIALINDEMFVNMDVIRYHIDNDVPVEYFEKWYWKGLDVYELTGQNYMNYMSFCKGAPDIWTDERMESIREARKRVDEAQQDLENMINDILENGGDYTDY